MAILAIFVSRNHEWIVGGTDGDGAIVWDGEMQEQVVRVEGTSKVSAVDVSPDSTRFATGTDDGDASIWSITTGQRLVDLLKHDGSMVSGIRFSPGGERIANACYPSIRIFDSRTGDKLIAINTFTVGWTASTPLAWSSDGQQIFSASCHNRIGAFDASTGTQLGESQTLHGDDNNVRSIALAANGKFLATLANDSSRVSFLDTSTLARIGPVIEGSEDTWSISISPDSSYLATGFNGKIVIRDLGKILPELYGPFNVSICAFILAPFHLPR